MAWASCAMVVSAWASEGKLEVGSLALFAGVGSAATVLAVKVLGGIPRRADDERRRATQGAGGGHSGLATGPLAASENGG